MISFISLKEHCGILLVKSKKYDAHMDYTLHMTVVDEKCRLKSLNAYTTQVWTKENRRNDISRQWLSEAINNGTLPLKSKWYQ